MTTEDIKIIKDDVEEFILSIHGLSKETKESIKTMLITAKIVDDAMKNKKTA